MLALAALHELHLAGCSTATREVPIVELLVLQGGFCTADRIVTVSPGYAYEIQTPEGGWGMESLLRSRAYALNGVSRCCSRSGSGPALACSACCRACCSWAMKILLQSHPYALNGVSLCCSRSGSGSALACSASWEPAVAGEWSPSLGHALMPSTVCPCGAHLLCRLPSVAS